MVALTLKNYLMLIYCWQPKLLTTMLLNLLTTHSKCIWTMPSKMVGWSMTKAINASTCATTCNNVTSLGGYLFELELSSSASSRSLASSLCTLIIKYLILIISCLILRTFQGNIDHQNDMTLTSKIVFAALATRVHHQWAQPWPTPPQATLDIA